MVTVTDDLFDPDALQGFGSDARRAVVHAELEARELGHDRIGVRRGDTWFLRDALDAGPSRGYREDVAGWLPVAGDFDEIAFPSEAVGERQDQARFVLDQQNPRHACSASAPARLATAESAATPRTRAISGRLHGPRYATTASVSRAACDNPRCTGRSTSRAHASAASRAARNAQPPATCSSTMPLRPSR